ncbi:hypothetical protein JCGZ_12929 [Jatropha curcas]|uniref:HhH-GPD domain-containing protein n=1 Tax=Jatropha curcas TaxID=180498 RepID=A0A067KM69_JATCU|nr:hypothetical protein JCGZ_12929 [Jatropha curcas]
MSTSHITDSGESENGLPGAELVAKEVAAGPSGEGEETFDRLVDINACSNDVARHLDFFSSQESNEYHFDDLNPSFQDSTTAITDTKVNWSCSQESTTSFLAPPKLENVKNTESHAKPCYGDNVLQSGFISSENKKLHSVEVFEPTTPSLKPGVNKRPQRKPSKKSKVKKRRYRPKIALEVIPKRTVKNPVEKNLKRKYVKKSQFEKKNKRKKLSANSFASKTIEDDPMDTLKPMVKGPVIDHNTMQQNNIRKNIVSKILLGDLELDTDTLKWMTLRRRSPRDCPRKKFCCHLYQVGCRCIPSLSLIGSHSVSSSGSHQLEVDRIKLAFPGICKRRRIKRQRKSILSIILGFLHLQCNFVRKKRSKGLFPRLFARRNLASFAKLPMCNKMPDLNEIIGGTEGAEKDLKSNPIEKQEVINTVREEEHWSRNSKDSDTKIRLSLQLASTNRKGDRRFRPWKGSVVDSVVGVFLTQNVTDFLSSSTYMDLASKFPIQPTCHNNESQYFVTEVEENYRNESNSENELGLTVAAEATVMNKWIGLAPAASKPPKGKAKKRTDWNILRRKYSRTRNSDQTDSVDWEAVRTAPVDDLANVIEGRGQHRVLAKKIQDFLNREVEQTGTIDLEWLRYAPPDDAKEYLLEIAGIGLKSVECLRLLTLHHKAFPVDTNVARISVRLGWIPLQPLPGVQFHLLEEYELHYHMITFGKVFCTKVNPNCRSCPMRAECRHLASEIASKNLSLPSSSKKDEERSIVPCIPVGNSGLVVNNAATVANPIPIRFLESNTTMENGHPTSICKPIIEEPKSPQPVQENENCGIIGDIEDFPYDEEGIPTIKLSNEAFKGNVQYFMDKYCSQVGSSSRALVPRSIHVDSVPPRKLKQTTHLRTEHLVYELPDDHELVIKLPRRDRDDLFPYLLAIWTPGETADSWKMPEQECNSQVPDSEPCGKPTCLPCQSFLEANANIVRGTILVPIRTALKAKFPLNGTYFQVNEVFADDETSKTPLIVNRDSIGNLKRRTVYFGTSATSIFRSFICVRAWDSKTGAPKALSRRFHCPPSKMEKQKRGANKKSRDNAKGKASMSLNVAQ